MKKKYVGANFVLLLYLLNMLINPAAAIEAGERVDYEDGSYAIITTGSDSVIRAVKEDSKTYTYYNPTGQRCFSYTLYASFTYNGKTSSADDSFYTADIYRQGWDISTHREYISGNTAYGSATFTGPDDQTRPLSISLTCDKDGNVT